MKAIQLTFVKYYNVSFAEFFFLDYRSEFRTLLKDKTVSYFEETISQIDKLVKGYAESGRYIKLFAKQ